MSWSDDKWRLSKADVIDWNYLKKKKSLHNFYMKSEIWINNFPKIEKEKEHDDQI